jgi:myo-inositol-hexaphosphate 3-phosphohydrolase
MKLVAVAIAALILAPVAGAHPVTEHGTDGRDTMLGHEHPDTFYGHRAADALNGFAGPDTLYGNSGWDVIYGGRGSDILEGGLGYDYTHAGRGADVIVATDGRDDTIICGPGYDIAWIDELFDGASDDCDDVRSTPSDASFHSFGSVLVAPEFNVNGAGTNVDTIAFWEAPDPEQSLMFVTSKDVALVEVWRHPYRSASDQQAALRHACFGRGTNGVVVDQRADLLYVSPRNTLVCVFQLPELTFARSFDTKSTGGTSEPNLALLRTLSGEGRLYVSYDNVVQIHHPTSGAELGKFTPKSGIEAMAGDQHHQRLYIPDENGRTGVYEYTPDGAFTGVGFGSDRFAQDAEGVAIYECSNREGLIVVSDQTTSLNQYEVFDRRTKVHLGVLQLQGIAYTDGIASTQRSSTLYPDGVFAAIHSDTSAAGVSWKNVFSAISQKTGSTFGCPE